MPTAGYGSWRSPITAELITGRQVGLASPWLDGGDAYWTESRPLEGGRSDAAARGPDGAAEELTPAPFNLRTRVHEYGGRRVHGAGGVVVGVEFADQRLYRLRPGAEPCRSRPRATPAALRRPRLDLARAPRARGARGPSRRRRAGQHAGRGRRSTGGRTRGGAARATTSSPIPRPAPTAPARLAELGPPDMPWDATALWLAELDADGRSASRAIEGGRGEPGPAGMVADGALYVMSDRSDFWSLYRVDGRASCRSARCGRARRAALAARRAAGTTSSTTTRTVAIATERGPLAAGPRSTSPPARDAGSICRSSSAASAAPTAAPWSRRCRRRPAIVLLDPATGRSSVLASAPRLRRPGLARAPSTIEFPSDDGAGLRALLPADQPRLRRARRASCRR